MQRLTKLLTCFTIDKKPILGELVLDGEETKLKLSSRTHIPYDSEPHTLFGESLDHLKLSLYECVGYEPVSEGIYPNPIFKREIFPHFALVGTRHFEWSEQAFTSVSFKADDLGLLFSRRETFGSAWLTSEKFAEVLNTTPNAKQIELGESPAIFYFAGKRRSDPIVLPIGTFFTEIIFTGNVSNITGISCPAETVATLTYEAPKSLSEIIDDIISILDFVSTITGRPQGIGDIVSESIHDSSSPIGEKNSVYWSLAPESVEGSPSNHRDLPITPDRSEEEFNKVFCNWIHKYDDWATARSRILRWQKHGNIYDENRLIAAANAFDILPDSTYPAVGKLSEETALKRDRCKKIIMELKHGTERDQILGTLNFWGSKLLDKLLYKSKIVQESFNTHFQDLDEVVKIALKARNFYVHGTDYGHKHYYHLTPFLTNTLEFVFVAADLIECGWNASQWADRSPSFGHPMARFFYSYKSEIIRFNSAKKEARTTINAS